MRTNRELFDFLETLIKELEDSNDERAKGLANGLRRAAGISSVGTEIIMAIRKELTDLLESKIVLNKRTLDKVNEAIAGINSELST